MLCISIHFVLNENKISPNTGILFNGVLRPKLLNNPFASCSLLNFDFLLPHIEHVDKIIILPLVAFKTFGLILSVFLLHFKKYDNLVSFIILIFI